MNKIKMQFFLLNFFLSLIFLLSVNLYSQTSPEKLLLKDYRPKSIYNIPVSNIEKAKYLNTTFIACHLANYNHDLAVLGDMFDKYPNFYADISARYSENVPVPKYTEKFLEKSIVKMH